MASIDQLAELNPNALLADGFESAFMGWIENRWVEGSGPLAVYSRKGCIAILVNRDGMSWEEAEEFFEFNVDGAYLADIHDELVQIAAMAIKGLQSLDKFVGGDV